MTALEDLPTGGYEPGVVPHLRVPFGLDLRGRAAIVDQDTDEEILQTVRVLLATRVGERAALPSYGLEDPVFFDFGEAPSEDEVIELVAEEEPRASVQHVAQAIDDVGLVTSTVGLRTIGDR